MLMWWLSLTALSMPTRCAADGGQLLPLVTWAVQLVTEPLLGQLAGQEARLGDLSDRLDSLAGLVANLSDRLVQLETSAGRYRLLERLSSRMEDLEKRVAQSVSNTSSSSRSEGGPRAARDCSDLPTGSKSGIYLLQPGLDRSLPPVPAFCDQETDGGGWTVFQRRADIHPRLDFFLDWAAYRAGFGELDMEFWWGLEHLFVTTSLRDRRYELRVDLEDFEGGRRHAVYQGFRVGPEQDGYRLQAANYSGTAGDSLSEHVGMRFSTRDRDQDDYHINCANTRMGAWWYNRCYHSNLNGRPFTGEFRRGQHGTTWRAWRGSLYSLKTVEMKFRPTMKAVYG